jgi:4,5-dihydroxyphthalate decarboxylase
LRGELDGLITARAPQSFLGGDPRIKRLWPDFRSAERAYFEATAIIPIMHVVVVRRSLVAAHPWLANNLVDAFEAARRPVQHDLLDTAVCTSSLIWESAYAEEEAALLGDPFRYGLSENEISLRSLLNYAHRQGFTDHPLDYEEVFVPSTLSSARI